MTKSAGSGLKVQETEQANSQRSKALGTTEKEVKRSNENDKYEKELNQRISDFNMGLFRFPVSQWRWFSNILIVTGLIWFIIIVNSPPPYKIENAFFLIIVGALLNFLND